MLYTIIDKRIISTDIYIKFLRETTERPEAVAAGTAKLVGTESKDIFAAASELLSNSSAYEAMANAINPFGDGHAAERILQIVQNYLSIDKLGFQKKIILNDCLGIFF